MENTLSRGLEGELTASDYTWRTLLTAAHCAVCTLCTPHPHTGGKNTVRKTQRMLWLMKIGNSNPLILFDTCCLPVKPKVSPVHMCTLWFGL